MLDELAWDFDGPRFWSAVAEARRVDRLDDPVRDWVRERGLRFVVQTRNLMSLDRLRGLVREAWGAQVVPDGLEVERLFRPGEGA